MEIPVITDEELMARTANGDLAAFNDIVLRYQQTAWNLVSRFHNDKSEVQDIAQDAFLRIFQAAPRYRPTASFGTYLYQVILRLCIDSNRKKRTVASDSVPESECPNPNPSQRLIQSERTGAVAAAVQRLPERQRIAIILKEYMDLSYDQIAEILHTTTKSVERLLWRGRAELRKEFKGML
jgi:RNA polymerase sigma-70 factor (ECF subfamily)